MAAPTLTTARLTIRPLRAEDAGALFRQVNDYSVAGNLARVPFPYPEALAATWIASTHEQAVRGEGYHLAITDAAGALLGCVGLTMMQGHQAELGYWIGRAHWRQGIATEAARALLDWGFAERGLSRVIASALVDNHGSQAVLRHLGFADAGTGMQDFMSRNRAMPVVKFALDVPARAAPTPKPVVLVAAVALVDADGRVLLAQRPAGKSMAGLWEFPGGKVEAGETPEAALIRELKEELDIDVTAACLAPLTFASHGYEKFHLLMPLFVCRRWKGILRGREGQELAWVRPARLKDYPMPPADEPLIAIMQEML
jgi:8-oxo-dGTP diphosphatase